MGYKPVGVDSSSSLFPPRVMEALKAIFTQKTSLSTVASTGRYSDLIDKPTVPTTASGIGAEPAGLSSATKDTLNNTYALKGQSGTGGSTVTTYTQSTASKTWNFTHNLGHLPIIAVYTSDGTLVFPDVQATNSTIVLTFAALTSGSVTVI